MTDNRTAELLDGLRHVGNLHEFAELFGFDWHGDDDWTWHDVAVKMADKLDQAIAATLGSETCAFAKPTDLTDGCAVLERIAELEELVQDWQALYEHPDYGDCVRLRKRMQALGIEVIDE